MKNPRPLHVDGFHGAHLVAAKAADAALWRDVRLFVFHRDGVARADLGALAAADAFASVDLRARGQPFFHAGHGPTQRARRFVGKADIRKARGQLVIRHGRGSLRIAAQQRLVQRRLAQAAGVGGGKHLVENGAHKLIKDIHDDWALMKEAKAQIAELEPSFHKAGADDDEDGEYYFDDTYGTDYVFRSGVGLVGVRIMVACGGPNIYVDSYREEVVGYWGGDEVHYPIRRDVADRITDAFEDIASCELSNFYN